MLSVTIGRFKPVSFGLLTGAGEQYGFCDCALKFKCSPMAADFLFEVLLETETSEALVLELKSIEFGLSMFF